MSKQKLIPLIFLLTVGACAFAANGVPLEVLREDPYSMDGTSVSAAEKNRAKSVDGLAEEEEEETESTSLVFTNADNWPLAPWTNYTATPESAIPTDTAPEDITLELAKVKKDDEVTELLKKTKRIHIDAFYSPSWTVTALRSGSLDIKPVTTIPRIGSMDSTFTYIDLLSFGGRFELSLAKVFVAAGGFGADVTWSSVKNGDSGKAVNEIEANLFAALRFKPTDKFAFVVQAGGGAVLFFNAEDISTKLSWINPAVSGGINLEWYFLKIFSFSVGVRASLPFLFVDNKASLNPLVHVDLGVGIHL